MRFRRTAVLSLATALLPVGTLAPVAAHAATGQSVTVAQKAKLTRTLSAYMKGRSGQASVSITDLATGRSYTYNAGLRTATASIVKADILASLLLRAQDRHRSLTSSERSLASRMIRYSDNDAATALFDAIGGRSALVRYNKRLGLKQTVPSYAWGATTTSAADQIRLLETFTSAKSKIKSSNRAYALGLMHAVTSAQHWGVSAAAKKGDYVALKNGWLPRPVDGGRWTINTIGRVRGHGHDYLIAVISRRNSSMGAGITTVEHLAKAAARALD
jgi:beta-lactamase class A